MRGRLGESRLMRARVSETLDVECLSSVGWLLLHIRFGNGEPLGHLYSSDDVSLNRFIPVLIWDRESD